VCIVSAISAELIDRKTVLIKEWSFIAAGELAKKGTD
jgi:hypothetical protein